MKSSLISRDGLKPLEFSQTREQVFEHIGRSAQVDTRRHEKHRHCCELMTYYLQQEDHIVVYSPKFREYGIRVQDGDSFEIGEPVDSIAMNFCPWCGSQLPGSLRLAWFDALEKMGIEDCDDPRIPEEYKSDSWWNKADSEE